MSVTKLKKLTSKINKHLRLIEKEHKLLVKLAKEVMAVELNKTGLYGDKLKPSDINFETYTEGSGRDHIIDVLVRGKSWDSFEDTGRFDKAWNAYGRAIDKFPYDTLWEAMDNEEI